MEEKWDSFYCKLLNQCRNCEYASRNSGDSPKTTSFVDGDSNYVYWVPYCYIGLNHHL